MMSCQKIKKSDIQQNVVIGMNPVVKLFANPTLVDVLSLFLQNADEELYQTDIVKRTGKALMQVQRALKTLQEVGLISVRPCGRQIYYKVIKSHAIFEDLKKLFLKTIALGDSIRDALIPLGNKIHFAFIFGSIAQGNESSDSDIDLFILGEVTLRELSKALGYLSKKLKRELNPVLFGIDEFKKRLSNNDHFLIEVVNKSKIWIVGDESEWVKKRIPICKVEDAYEFNGSCSCCSCV